MTVAIIGFVIVAAIGVYLYSQSLRDALRMHWRQPPEE